MKSVNLQDTAFSINTIKKIYYKVGKYELPTNKQLYTLYYIMN